MATERSQNQVMSGVGLFAVACGKVILAASRPLFQHVTLEVLVVVIVVAASLFVLSFLVGRIPFQSPERRRVPRRRAGLANPHRPRVVRANPNGDLWDEQIDGPRWTRPRRGVG